MNKETEISILFKTAHALGEASYLGPWLKSIIGELERDLRSDIIPVITLADARQQAECILAEARNKAEAHYTKVVTEAARLRTDDEVKAQRAIETAKVYLTKAAASL